MKSNFPLVYCDFHGRFAFGKRLLAPNANVENAFVVACRNFVGVNIITHLKSTLKALHAKFVTDSAPIALGFFKLFFTRNNE